MVTRAEHRRTTLLRLSDAAIERFAADGASATIDAIAKQAGMSRRTVFRYVDSKEELAYLHPVLWFDVFDQTLSQLGPEMPIVDRLRIASMAIADHIDADPEPPRQAFMIGALTPGLQRGFIAVFQRWIDRIASEVAPHTDDPFRARVVGSAVMGMVDGVSREWLVSPPERTYRSICEDGFEVIRPLLNDLEDAAAAD